MPYVQLSNLDFNDIKTALKEYLRSQTDFTDFDFEGSVWSNLLDVLAYNTYYTAFNTNMVLNETFLDSATLRDNVVALAKQLGYRPKSAVAPKAVLNFRVNFPVSGPNEIILKRGTGFTSTYDTEVYNFVAVEDIKALVQNNTAVFTNIPLYEGNFVTDTYTVNSNKNQRYIIKNPSADTSTIRVRVFPSEQSTVGEVYARVDNILSIDGTSNIYYLEEIEDEQYEIFFGDGVLGKRIESGNQIEITYLSTNGPDANGARSFTFNGVLEDPQGNSNYNYSILYSSATDLLESASGGATIESIKKIKFNAPRYYGTQSRAVTAQDYAAIVREIYPAIADIITFGGEEDDPPEYGKVKIVVKPSTANRLSSATKKQIADALKPYMVASVVPDIIDASILYVEMNSSIYYDKTKTNQTADEIRSKVISALETYISGSDTEKFNGKFRYSKFVGVIDDADRSINSNLTTIKMRKDFYPSINNKFFYEICFQNAFDDSCEEDVIVQSSGFKVSEYPLFTVFLEDRMGKMVLYRIDSITGEKIVLNDSVGTVDYKKGEIRLFDLTIIEGSFFDNRIEIRTIPLSNDIRATREVYLDVDIPKSSFTIYTE
ncbi:baseplate wedge [Synechococcus phage S-PM2]|uniref:Baseplate wedge n=1 Tax=Synechococcus phage S-PM2 TaxID=238854 RepID=Q5GQU0_BPSYP|nr:baseplate wedge subunit [Synechococcus phage S-PM2]CAF34144.1 baseplate wedge [Synechococcus phage S-PM2]CFW42208.1 baseplate wedge [Synechococcus phage S-PM2]